MQRAAFVSLRATAVALLALGEAQPQQEVHRFAGREERMGYSVAFLDDVNGDGVRDFAAQVRIGDDVLNRVDLFSGRDTVSLIPFASVPIINSAAMLPWISHTFSIPPVVLVCSRKEAATYGRFAPASNAA